MANYEDVLGSKPPGPTEGQKDPKYSHWCNPGSNAKEFSADKNAMAENRAGMQGKDNPFVPYEDRERGDASAKGRANQLPGAGHDHSWFTDQFKEDK